MLAPRARRGGTLPTSSFELLLFISTGLRRTFKRARTAPRLLEPIQRFKGKPQRSFSSQRGWDFYFTPPPRHSDLMLS